MKKLSQIWKNLVKKVKAVTHPHTAESVVRELIAGLKDGSIVLDKKKPKPRPKS